VSKLIQEQSPSSQYQSQQQQKQKITLEGQAYINFSESLRAPETRRLYDHCLKRYMKYCGVQNVDDLLKDQDNPKLIQSKIIEYIVTMRKSPYNLSHANRHLHLSAISTFYTMNDVVINKKRISRYLGEATKEFRDRAYTYEEIQKMLAVCDLRMRAIICFLPHLVAESALSLI
jgi:integrase